MKKYIYFPIKIVTIIIILILWIYLGILLGNKKNNNYVIDLYQENYEKVASNKSVEYNNYERSTKVSSRSGVRVPSNKYYNVYKVIIQDYTLYFDNYYKVQEFKDKILNLDNRIDIQIEKIKETALDDINNNKEIDNVFTKISNKINKCFYPTLSKTISSKFGYRISPTRGASSFHKGIDISAKYGDPIYSYKSGTIIKAQFDNSGYGNMILIQHKDGTQTRYGHLSKILVNKGQYVNGGELIGKVGSTGISTGNHLHFEIIINGSVVDPYTYLFN